MNDYETMVILHPDLGEAGTKEMVQRARSILEADKGQIRAVDEWGVRELAYPIAKQKRGYYVVIQYTAPPSAVAELERQLKLSDSALRFLTIRQIHKKQLPPRRPRQQPDVEEMPEDLA